MKTLIKSVIIFIFFNLFTQSSYSQTYQEDISINEHFVLATLYAQVSGEFKALQIQAFNIGRLKIEEYKIKNGINGNETIVLDIDETILETFPFEAKMIIENKKWPNGFDEYLRASICKPVPGSVEFLNYIDSLGIKIFYISNRNESQRETLIKNLNKYNFPQVTNENILLKDDTSNKEERRKKISKMYNILLFFGDNLMDFADIFDANSNEERNQVVQKNKNLFGNKFIVLPNPSYGNWEGLIYKNNWELSSDEMNRLRKETLKSLYDF